MSVRISLLAGIVLAGLLLVVSVVSAEGPCEKGFNYAEPQKGILLESVVRPLKWMLGLGSKEYPVGTEVEIFGETWDGRYVVFAAPCGGRSIDAQGVARSAVDCPTCRQSDQPIPAPIPVPSSTPTAPPPPPQTATPGPSATQTPEPTATASATLAVAPAEGETSSATTEPVVVATHTSPAPDPTLKVVAASYAATGQRGLLSRLASHLPIGKIALGLVGILAIGIGWLTLQNRHTSMERIVESAVERHQREEQRIEQRGSWLERHDLWLRRVASYLGPLGKARSPVTVVLPHDFSVPFQGFGGLDNLKRWVASQDHARFSSALFCGLTGTGKTTVALEIAKVRRVPVIYFNIGQLLMDRVGRSEEVLHWVMDQLDRLFPGSVLLWDQAEKEIGPIISGEASYGDGGVRENVYSELTSRMTTNRMPRLLFIVTVAKPEVLNEEALRRFDTIWYFPPLDQETGLSVLRALLDERPILVKSPEASDESIVWAVGRAVEGLTPDQIKAVVKKFGTSTTIGFNELVGLLDEQERFAQPESWERLTRNPRYRNAHAKT